MIAPLTACHLLIPGKEIARLQCINNNITILKAQTNFDVFSPSPTLSFNQLDLPAYESYEKLRHMLLLAIQECSEGFGLA